MKDAGKITCNLPPEYLHFGLYNGQTGIQGIYMSINNIMDSVCHHGSRGFLVPVPNVLPNGDDGC
jgi:hypothetical protein